MEGGVETSVDGIEVKQWMILGSDLEDGENIDLSSFSSALISGLSFARPLNHFHEPIANIGLDGNPSSIHWSLTSLGNQFPGGPWSWNDAREYFYKALTSTTKSDRHENWGKTFRALGQVMHLLQDAANPSHVRNDPHPFNDGLHDFMERKSTGSFLGGGIFSPNPRLVENVGTAGPNGEPLSNLFDSNKYTGLNPQVTFGRNIGISEYASANFFSDDTIPGQGRSLSMEIMFPKVSELVPEPAPSPYYSLPQHGSPGFPGARAAKLTGNQAVAQFLITNTQLDLLGQLQLDDSVYDGQSFNLIPRAVGYSAEVLKYFFRDTIPVEDNSFYCFEPENPDQTPTYGIKVDVLIASLDSPTEFHDGGKFSAYLERPNGERELMGEYIWDSSSLGETIDLGTLYHGDDLGHPNPLPVMIVYDGKLGPAGAEEPRGVVGKTHLITNFLPLVYNNLPK